MFEQDFENMFADIWFDNNSREDADMEGIGFFENGDNTMHTIDALVCIEKYDRALKGNHYRAKRNRMRAQRNAIVTAFGPEMAARVGYAK